MIAATFAVILFGRFTETSERPPDVSELPTPMFVTSPARTSIDRDET
jgi:hypothetical protein